MNLKKINQETRSVILIAAKKEFASHGFAGARMDSIAKEASVNKAMLHYYFNSKELLYKEVVRYLVEQGIKSDHSFNDLGVHLSASQKLYLFIYYFVNMHFQAIDHDFHRIIAWDFAEGKNCMKMLVKDYFAPALERIERIVQEGIQKGEFASVNPIMSVWSFVVFIISYINQQDIYEGTGVYKNLYGKNSRNNLLDFLLVHVFKSLSPVAEVKIPEIPPDLFQKIDKKISEMTG